MGTEMTEQLEAADSNAEQTEFGVILKDDLLVCRTCEEPESSTDRQTGSR